MWQHRPILLPEPICHWFSCSFVHSISIEVDTNCMPGTMLGLERGSVQEAGSEQESPTFCSRTSVLNLGAQQALIVAAFQRTCICVRGEHFSPLTSGSKGLDSIHHWAGRACGDHCRAAHATKETVPWWWRTCPCPLPEESFSWAWCCSCVFFQPAINPTLGLASQCYLTLQPPAYILGPLSFLGCPEGLWMEPRNEKKLSSFSSNPYLLIQRLLPTFQGQWVL